MAITQMDISGWLTGSHGDHGQLSTLNQRANHAIRWGHRVYVASACLCCLTIALPMSFLEIAGTILMGMLVARLSVTWRLFPAFLQLPVFLFTIACCTAALLSLMWSPDVMQGLDDLDSLRWALFFPALWPLRHLRHWFLICISLSFLAANTCQLVQALAFEFGWEHLDFDAYPDRISGWLSPASGASILVAALGLHLPAALQPKHPLRWIARVLTIISLLAVLATGARGAWIAATLLIVISVAHAAWHSRQRARLFIAATILAFVTLTTGWLVLGDEIRSRVDEARTEIRGAIDDENYATSTGARINMWLWAGKAFSQHPIVGVGEGGYRAWVNQQQLEQGIDTSTQPVAGHAHGMYVHIAASHGITGLALITMLGGAILLVAAPKQTELLTYQAGICMAIVGLMLAGIFDTVHINAQTAAVLWMFVALSMRPSNNY